MLIGTFQLFRPSRECREMAVLAEICDRVAVMQQGRIVEAGPARTVLTHPEDDYTKELVAAVPRLGRREEAP